MRVTIDINDDLYQSLKARSGGDKGKAEVNKRIKAVLGEFNPVGADGNRYFVVEGEDRQGIEAIFETTVSDAPALIKHIGHLSTVGIGEVTQHLTEGQSRQMTEQAQFWGQTGAEYFKSTMEKVLDETLGRV